MWWARTTILSLRISIIRGTSSSGLSKVMPLVGGPSEVIALPAQQPQPNPCPRFERGDGRDAQQHSDQAAGGRVTEQTENPVLPKREQELADQHCQQRANQRPQK